VGRPPDQSGPVKLGCQRHEASALLIDVLSAANRSAAAFLPKVDFDQIIDSGFGIDEAAPLQSAPKRNIQ